MPKNLVWIVKIFCLFNDSVMVFANLCMTMLSVSWKRICDSFHYWSVNDSSNQFDICSSTNPCIDSDRIIRSFLARKKFWEFYFWSLANTGNQFYCIHYLSHWYALILQTFESSDQCIILRNVLNRSAATQLWPK